MATAIALRLKSNWYAGMIVHDTVWHYAQHAYGTPDRALELACRSAHAQDRGHDQTQWMSRHLTLAQADALEIGPWPRPEAVRRLPA
jgi:hypothetical protein